ncbi:hypothetical protein SSX86_031361 [Deinandra increscens subsp. villosa]|uniref:BURP domain-containing protein n=1 Tax=Deinandra increscens subsp. villosa TaxID=3103831 RepID=A0AAP0C986_9ASTR
MIYYHHFHTKFITLIIIVVLVGSHEVTPEAYWKDVLPNSPMPKAITESLKEWNDENGITLGVNARPKNFYTDTSTDQQKVDHYWWLYTSKDQHKDDYFWLYKSGASKDQHKDEYFSLYKSGESKDQHKDDYFWLYKSGASKDQHKDDIFWLYKSGASNDQQKDDHNDHFWWLYKSSASKDRQKDHPKQSYNYSSLKDQLKHYLFNRFRTYGESKDQRKDNVGAERSVYAGVESQHGYAMANYPLKDNPNAALFFLQKELRQGTEMNLWFTKNNQQSMFLPRKIVVTIPFSSNNLSQIYSQFSIKPDSTEAELMKLTLNGCENKGIEGEEKYCATSLESMIDFVTSKLGHKAKAISTEVNAKESVPLQKYEIKFAKKLVANEVVICHKHNYPYAVFYCHKSVGTQAYVVSMVGRDSVKVNAVAVCHSDTSKWNPKHLAFRVLKVKPGSVPVCHFLPEDHVVWIPY